MNSRYYNPVWGRYLNADIFGGIRGELLSHNVFAYCKNNTVNLEDPSGNLDILGKMWQATKKLVKNLTEVIGKVTQFLTPSTQTKIATGIVAGIVAYKIFMPQKVSAKRPSMLGEKGTKVPSKTMWQKGKTERIDIENPTPGMRPGDIHYHEPNNTKWRFNLETRKFHHIDTNKLAPSKIQKVLENVEVQKAIEKGLKYLGESIQIFK